MQHAWNSYLRLIYIDYTENLCCRMCKECAPIIILDGIAMGTTRLLPTVKDNTDTSQEYHIIPLVERIYIPDLKSRNSQYKFIKSGISPLEYTNVLKSVQPEFAKFVIYCSEEIGTIRKVSQKYPIVYEVIQTLSRCESICGIIRISAISVQQRKLFFELSQGKTVTLSEIQAIYHKTIFLKHLTIHYLPTLISRMTRSRYRKT